MAYILMLFLPLSLGLSRHYMPETMVLMFTALFAACALKYNQEQSLRNAIVAALVLVLVC